MVITKVLFSGVCLFLLMIFSGTASASNDMGGLRGFASSETANAMKSMAYDTNKNGKKDKWEHYERGQLVMIEMDTNEDGRLDERQTIKDGKVVKIEKAPALQDKVRA